MKGEWTMLKQKLKRSDEFLATSIDDEIVMMDVETGHYFGLTNAVSAFIWEILEDPKTGAEIQAEVAENFDVNPAQSDADVEAFLAELLDNKILVPET